MLLLFKMNEKQQQQQKQPTPLKKEGKEDRFYSLMSYRFEEITLHNTQK